MTTYKYRPLTVEAFHFVLGPDETFDQACDRLGQFVNQDVVIMDGWCDRYAQFADDYGDCEIEIGDWVVKNGQSLLAYEHEAFIKLFEPIG